MAQEFNLGVINADHTNRDVELNTPRSLADALHSLVTLQDKMPDGTNRLITVTEFGKKAYSLLDQQLPEDFDSYGNKFKARDFTASFWSENEWKVEYRERRMDVIWSDPGKYSAVVLENENTNKRLLFVSVHLPHKCTSMKRASKNLLEKLIKEDAPEKYHTDAVIVAGDFNMIPSEVIDMCGSEFNIGIESDNTPTTRLNSSVDNVVTSDAMRPVVEIYDAYERLSHYPLFANLRFNDEN